MVRTLWWLVASLTLTLTSLGCPGEQPPNDRPDAGEEEEELPENITVSGTAQVYPDALSYLSDAGQGAPELQGLLLRVQEPFFVATGNLAEGIFGEVRLTNDGAFSVATVKPEVVTLGVGVGILDDMADGGTPRVTRAATTVYDVALENGKPELDITEAVAYALPVAFTEALETAVGQSNINTISGQMDLAQAGFILGKIVDANGMPVAGAAVEFIDSTSFATNLFYPTADLTSANQTSTSASGLFVYVKSSAGTTDTFKFKVKDRPEYLPRNGGAAKEAGLIITVTPGS